MDVPRPTASKAPLNQSSEPAPATAQHTVGASASSVQESCSLENSLPQPAPLAFTTAMPSGFRRFNKRPTTQGEPQGSVADSQTALSVASPSVYVAAASPIDPLGSTGFRIRKRVKSAEAYIRPHTASTSTEMAPFASERIRAVPMDRCGAAEGAAECDHAICGLNKAFNLLKSPTKAAGTSAQLVCAEPSSTQLVCAPGAQLVPFRAQGQLFLGGGTALTDAQLKEVKFEQRQSNNLYHSAFFFPASRVTGGNLTDEHRLDRQSLRRAIRYICLGTLGCKFGDCLSQLQESDVSGFRQMSAQRTSPLNGKRVTWKQLMTDDLQHSYNRTTEVWEPVCIPLDGATSVRVCPASYALLCGCAPTTLYIVIQDIRASEVSGGQLALLDPAVRSAHSATVAREQRSEDWCLLRAYVAELLDKHEANPAPGAHQPGRITHINKQTWKAKWAAVQIYFRNASRVPGSHSMLKRVWRLETRLKEKKACSHSKCNICSQIDANMDALRGVNTGPATRQREFNQRAQAEHDALHLGSRTELDTAGLQGFNRPRDIWTILVDAATQRNFMLPKFKFRVPKKLAGRPFWSYKLMATYGYGYGFTPYLVHSSQSMGANLTWTVLWLTLCDMRKHYGYWPQTLHITVDNTTGENKNETLLVMCAWLVASGKVKQVSFQSNVLTHIS